MKLYEKPNAEYVQFASMENVTMGVTSYDPFAVYTEEKL